MEGLHFNYGAYVCRNTKSCPSQITGVPAHSSVLMFMKKIKGKIERDFASIIGRIRKPTNQANLPKYVSNTPWLVDKWTHHGFCVVLVFNELEEIDTNKWPTRGPYL